MLPDEVMSISCYCGPSTKWRALHLAYWCDCCPHILVSIESVITNSWCKLYSSVLQGIKGHPVMQLSRDVHKKWHQQFHLLFIL